MATLDELRLQQLLQPFEGPQGIASFNPLAFQYQDQQYLNQDPTQDFYEQVNISPTQSFYPLDRNPTQMFYQPRDFVNAPGAIDYYQPDLTTLKGLDMNKFQGVSDRSMIDETTNDEQDEEYIDLVDPSNNKSGGIIDLIMSAVMPGYNFIKGAINKPQSYQQFSPGTSIRNGIVSIDGVNTPYGNFGGDFYNPNTGLNRFDRARNRFNKTGSTLDLFGSSRTGKEFFENRRRIKEQKRLATDRNRRLEKDIQTRMMDGESLSDIGKSTFTGPGRAFEQQSGGVTGKGTANERNYGGR